MRLSVSESDCVNGEEEGEEAQGEEQSIGTYAKHIGSEPHERGKP